MNLNFPVFTTENICHDCYKCIRHCPCKAIRIVNGRAGVIQDLCVACGMCVKVCPAHAKKIRPDLARARYLLGSGKKIYASLAPSFVSYSKGWEPGALAAALKRLGFAGVGETALGAQAVSAETGLFLASAKPGIYLSSACPAVVDYVRKYAPAYVKSVIPVLSPVLTHAKLLRKAFGNDIGVIFFGPCVAKKNEADRHPALLDLALTFADLAEWLASENIDPAAIDKKDWAEMVPKRAREGKIYAVEGGMNDTLRDPQGGDIRYHSVSGLDHLARLLQDPPDQADIGNCKLFIECLACSGGCVNGPVMQQNDAGTLSSILRVARGYDGTNSLARKVEVPIDEPVIAEPQTDPEVTEEAIKNALASVGKFTPADELNCGGCGYSSCRDFARALLANKAEVGMCVSYLRKLAQKKSNALIRYIPAGVVIVDRHMKIVECNRHFAELFDEDTVLAYDSCGGLTGAELGSFADFSDLVASAMISGGEVERHNQVCGDKILNISVFCIAQNQSVGAIIQDVTSMELHREQVSEKARKVIQKNIITCQKIARDLGEHMAETEILLREVAGSYAEIKKRGGHGK